MTNNETRRALIDRLNVARSTAMIAEKTNRPVRFQNKCWKAYFAAEDALKAYDGKTMF